MHFFWENPHSFLDQPMFLNNFQGSISMPWLERVIPKLSITHFKSHLLGGLSFEDSSNPKEKINDERILCSFNIRLILAVPRPRLWHHASQGLRDSPIKHDTLKP